MKLKSFVRIFQSRASWIVLVRVLACLLLTFAALAALSNNVLTAGVAIGLCLSCVSAEIVIRCADWFMESLLRDYLPIGLTIGLNILLSSLLFADPFGTKILAGFSCGTAVTTVPIAFYRFYLYVKNRF